MLVLLSGGLDSACCLDLYKDLGRSVSALHISYGQPAEDQELLAVQAVAAYYQIPLNTASWRASAEKTVGEISGRNAFLVMAALMEASPCTSTIALGIHSGTAYADCSAEFIEACESLVSIYGPPRRVVGTPFLDWRKADIFAYARARNVPVDLTYSCERGGLSPCGSCVSCVDMIELHAHAS